MTLAEAAAALGVSVRMVAKLRRQSQLPAVRTPSGYFIYLATDVRALVARRSKAPKMKDGRIAFGALG